MIFVATSHHLNIFEMMMEILSSCFFFIDSFFYFFHFFSFVRTRKNKALKQKRLKAGSNQARRSGPLTPAGPSTPVSKYFGVKRPPKHERDRLKSLGITSLKAPTRRRSAERARTAQGIVPYSPGDRILVVGDGNFSFSRGLCARLREEDKDQPVLVTATALDSHEQGLGKYPDIDGHVAAVRTLGGTVVFGVDGRALAKCKELRGLAFDKIVFNFPHKGSGVKDEARNVAEHQELLLGFFTSAKEFLAPGGQIHVTIKAGPR